MSISEINYLDIDENQEYCDIINSVLNQCFEEEKLNNKKLYVNVVLTNAKNIKQINKEHRNIDKETDVLSFPMYEPFELKNLELENEDVLGDMVISIERVKEQAIEYGHSFKRELAYMVVHSFYHLIGYDHINEDDKKNMRIKEENILEKLEIRRGQVEN